MIKNDYKYVWENRRGVYRVVTDTPEYNKETKKTVHHYVTVGKAMEKNGPVEFGSKFQAVKKAQGEPVQAKSVVLSGETLALSKACTDTGLRKALVSSFGKETAERILGLAFYLVCTGDALSSSQPWLEERGLKGMDAPRISELLPSLGEEECSSFFKAWVKKNAKDRTLCYDITSVSTYAKDINPAEYGYNRDHEKWLRQINLALLTDKATHLPLAFRTVNGSLSDVQTLKDTVRDLEMYGACPSGMVMDRGFWSTEKLQMLTDAGIRYMIPVPSSVKWARSLISENRDGVFARDPRIDDSGVSTYGCTVYDPTKSGRRVWAHVFYSPSIETDRKERFVSRYIACRKELQDNDPNEKHQAFYDEYFTVSTRGRGGKRRIEDKVPLSGILAGMNFGYWVLYTDMEKDAFTALDDYRDRAFIEAGFDDLKGATDAKRLRVHHGKSVNGRLFMQFCAQVLRTSLRNSIAGFPSEAKKYASSVDALLARVRSYSKVTYKGRYGSQYTVMTKGQKLIFAALGIADCEQEEEEDGTETLLS